jgi:hypothetical protein
MAQEINRYHIYTSSLSTTPSGGVPSSSYAFNIHKPLILTHPSHYYKLLVKQVSIPYSFQAVVPPYNTLVYRLQRGVVNYGQRTITIPNGNYSIYDLITAVQSAMLADVMSYSTFVPSFFWNYSADTSLVTFTVTNLDSVATTFTIYDDNQALGDMLGIGANITFGYSATNVPVVGLSTQVVNCSPITQLFIRSNSLKQKQNIENLTNGLYNDYSNIIGVVPVLVQPKSWIQFWDLNIENILNNQEITEIQLFLTDNRNPNTPINLNGLAWNCSMTLIEYRGADLLENDAYLANIQLQRKLRENNLSIRENAGGPKGSIRERPRAIEPESPPASENTADTEASNQP